LQTNPATAGQRLSNDNTNHQTPEPSTTSSLDGAVWQRKLANLMLKQKMYILIPARRHLSEAT
jgi:hypothetical protein